MEKRADLPGVKETNLGFALVYYEKPIVHLVFEKGAELGFPEMRALVRHAERASGHQPYVVLSDIRKGVSVTPEGRKFSSRASESPLQRGTATLVTGALFSKAVNFFAGLRKPDFPFRCFTDRQEAIEWLLTLKL